MPAPSISPAQLEDEIRTGAPIVVVDVREPDAFDHWPLDAGETTMVNIPLSRIEADPHGVLAALGGGARAIRTMCARGRTAELATTRLVAAGAEAMTVTGGMRAWAQLLVAATVPMPTATRVVQFRREARGCLSYLIASDGEALVVDPAPAIAHYLDEATRLGVTITHVLDTHIHADHLSGMWALADAVGARVHLSAGAIARGGDPRAVQVYDGDSIAVGSAVVRVVELPGHTSDNVGVLIDDAALIAGDSLFADSVARPDLEVGDAGAATAARQLYQTIQTRIMTLDPKTRLLPCHYSGGRLTNPIAPTLGEVRGQVTLLRLDEDAFVRQVLEAMPPRPDNYEQIIATNLACGNGDDVASLEVGANNCAAS